MPFPQGSQPLPVLQQPPHLLILCCHGCAGFRGQSCLQDRHALCMLPPHGRLSQEGWQL